MLKITVVVLAALTCAARACGSFSSASDASDAGADAAAPGTDGGAGRDSEGGVVVSSGCVQSGAGAVLPNASESFDAPAGAPTWGPDWVAVGNAPEVDLDQQFSAPASLLVSQQPGKGGGWLQRDVGLPCRLRIETQLMFNLEGDGRIAVLALDDGATPARGIGIIHDVDGLGVEAVQGPGDPAARTLLARSAVGWTPLKLEIDLGKKRWFASYDGHPVEGALPEGWPTTKKLVVKLGASLVASVNNEWDYHHDDVVLTLP